MIQTLWESVLRTVGAYLPNLVGAIAILILGWLVAWIVGFVIYKVLKKVGLDNAVARWTKTEHELHISKWIGRIAYYLLLLLVLVAFFEALNLTIVTEPLNRILIQIYNYLPNVLAASAIMLAAWIIAEIARLLIHRLLTALKVDRHVPAEGEEKYSVARTASDAFYWLVLLLFLPAILGALNLKGLLQPVQDMVDQVIGFLPNLLAAIIIFLIGWFVARILQQITVNVLAATNIDRLIDRQSEPGKPGTISNFAGILVYILVLIPVAISALDALKISAISEPAKEMLTMVFRAIPPIFTAALILFISWLVARLLANFTVELLKDLKFDSFVEKTGIIRVSSQYGASKAMGNFVILIVMLFASIEAAQMLGFTKIADLLYVVTVFAGQLFLAFVIFVLGVYLANYLASGIKNRVVAETARFATIFITIALALRESGIASDIINIAFGLLLGALAVAIALAFGLGGKDVAARILKDWVKSIENEKTTKKEE